MDDEQLVVTDVGSKASGARTNPYDFRNPVKRADRLVGRERELERVEKCIDATSQGQPIHMALIGERAAGKTSLLNITQSRARDSGLLVVKVDLDESVVTTTVSFFSALFQSAMGALADAGAFADDSSRFNAWNQQVLMGADVPVSDQTLLFANIAAAQVRGLFLDDVTPYVLKHDFDKIAELALGIGLKGVLLALDEGDLLGTKEAIFQKLRNVLQDSTAWMLITAGTRTMFTTMSEVFSPIPRQFERIQVEGLSDRIAVRNCMRKPLPKETQVVLPMHVVDDVMAITHGRPYEINLVCHFIWEEIDDHDTDVLSFKLTHKVLDNVLEELRDLSLESSVKEVDQIRALGPMDFEDLADVVPLTKMTIRQAALSRLLPLDFDEQKLIASENKVNDQLDNLVKLGIMRRHGDRFQVVADEFVEVYLKFELARHGREHEHSAGYGSQTFARAVADAFLPTFLVLSDGISRDPYPLMVRPSELGHSQTRSLGERLSKDIKDRNVLSLNRLPSLAFFLIGIGSEEDEFLRIDVSRHHVAFGITLEVGVELVDIIQLVETDIDAMGVELRLLAWRDEQESILKKYDTRVREIVTEDLAPDLLTEIRDFVDARQGRYQEAMYKAFEASDYAGAKEVTRPAVRVLERHLERYIGMNKYRREQDAWSNAVNREGFLTLLMDEPVEAKQLFERALSIDNEEKALRLFNLGRSHLALGEWTEAIMSFQVARSCWRQSDLWYLMAAIELPSAIRQTSALLTGVDLEWGWSFCEVHNLVAHIRRGTRQLSDLDQFVRQEFTDSGIPLVISRIQAWEHFHGGAHRRALEVLLHADRSHHGDEQLEKEISYLEREEGAA